MIPMPKSGSVATHLENPDVHISRDAFPQRPIRELTGSIPFIPAETVRLVRQQTGCLWIVIDNVVFDCTDFVNKHPGGATVIESFNGEDCSWQF